MKNWSVKESSRNCQIKSEILQKKLSVFFFLLLLVTSCSSVPGPTSTDWHHIKIESDTLVFKGDMNTESLAHAKRLIESSDIDVLRISSGGGEAMPSIAFAHFIHDRNMDVIVSRACFSSCANYILPAAASVLVESGAVVGWHGGAESDYSHESKAWTDSELNDWRAAERSLYEKTGTCWELSVHTKDSMPWYLAYFYDAWMWDKESLIRLGLKDITFEGDTLATKGKDLPSVEILHFKGPCKPYSKRL